MRWGYVSSQVFGMSPVCVRRYSRRFDKHTHGFSFKKLYKKASRCNTIRWLLKICFSSSDEPSEAKMLFLSSATKMVALRICKNWPSNSGYRDVMIADRPSDTSCSSRDTLADWWRNSRFRESSEMVVQQRGEQMRRVLKTSVKEDEGPSATTNRNNNKLALL